MAVPGYIIDKIQIKILSMLDIKNNWIWSTQWFDMTSIFVAVMTDTKSTEI